MRLLWTIAENMDHRYSQYPWYIRLELRIRSNLRMGESRNKVFEKRLRESAVDFKWMHRNKRTVT
jgi:hypothetical protein